MTPAVDPVPPLALTLRGDPAVYAVLGAFFHLEPLGRGMEDALSAANALVFDWIGSELRWSRNSSFGPVEPFRREDLEYIALYPSALAPPRYDDAAAQGLSNAMFARTYGDFSLDCQGGEEPAFPSPYGYGLYSEMPDPYQRRGDFHTCAVLYVAMPSNWPLADFQDRVCRLAAVLPIRWGAAGLTYRYATNDFTRSRRIIYAHARRHPGYDVGQYATSMLAWHERIRSVNWITIIGPTFAAALSARGMRPASTALVEVAPVGPHLLLRAGPQPEAGDINRLRIPDAYVRVDEMIRPLRASAQISFLNPWNETTTSRWLKRFELRPY